MSATSSISSATVASGWTKAVWDAEGWRSASACRDIDPEMFFPVGVTGDAMARADAAKEICRGCPVVEECLIFAVTTNQEYGIWGGLDEEERRDVRRKWRRATRRVADGPPAVSSRR
ncbi:WhiB family transcriptional regulator [Acidiferrimicrobium sp. IK]|uniref:WhiB family transcriptional regulator n=1 Tax=Acidiferrimicrobium sp. IK TaxID=2871700 RepID=UPI0021CB7D1E|nr:WhiB family transcriptional regulator [Acidiferrimicrobium sp. IK]MCU4187039.1 WhiB family transcriptional regulator [Acidiferrimicrobium sp. IK]